MNLATAISYRKLALSYSCLSTGCTIYMTQTMFPAAADRAAAEKSWLLGVLSTDNRYEGYGSLRSFQKSVYAQKEIPLADSVPHANLRKSGLGYLPVFTVHCPRCSYVVCSINFVEVEVSLTQKQLNKAIASTYFSKVFTFSNLCFLRKIALK